MTPFSEVIIDTNMFAWLKKINADACLFDILCEAYGGKPICDKKQFDIIDYFPELVGKVFFHDATDEEVAYFVMAYAKPQQLQKLMQDPADLKMLVYAIRKKSVQFLSCDRRLLILAREQGVSSACFKAAIHFLHEQLGDLFSSQDYQIADMFNASGTHPFYHYGHNKYCPQCDPKDQCSTRSVPAIT